MLGNRHEEQEFANLNQVVWLESTVTVLGAMGRLHPPENGGFQKESPYPRVHLQVHLKVFVFGSDSTSLRNIILIASNDVS